MRALEPSKLGSTGRAPSPGSCLPPRRFPAGEPRVPLAGCGPRLGGSRAGRGWGSGAKGAKGTKGTKGTKGAKGTNQKTKNGA